MPDMPEDLGTLRSKIEIDISNLVTNIAKSKTAIKDLDSSIKVSTAQIKQATKGIGTAWEDVSRSFQKYTSITGEGYRLNTRQTIAYWETVRRQGNLSVEVERGVTNTLIDLRKRLHSETIGTLRNVGIALTAFGAGVGLAMKNIVGAGIQMESLMRGLASVAGSAKEAELQLVRLKEVAKLPGLGLPEAIKGSTNLQATGMAARLAERALMAFGNALASVGKGRAELDGVILALTQISAKGKISAEEINQLAERLPQIRKAMKDAFGTANTEELQKRNLSPEQFIEGIIKQFEKLGKVTNGGQNSIENFQDALLIFKSTLGKTVLPEITKFLEAISKAIEKYTVWAEKHPVITEALMKFGIVLAGIGAVGGPILLLGIGIASIILRLQALQAQFALTAAVAQASGAKIASSAIAAGGAGAAAGAGLGAGALLAGASKVAFPVAIGALVADPFIRDYQKKIENSSIESAKTMRKIYEGELEILANELNDLSAKGYNIGETLLENLTLKQPKGINRSFFQVLEDELGIVLDKSMGAVFALNLLSEHSANLGTNMEVLKDRTGAVKTGIADLGSELVTSVEKYKQWISISGSGYNATVDQQIAKLNELKIAWKLEPVAMREVNNMISDLLAQKNEELRKGYAEGVAIVTKGYNDIVNAIGLKKVPVVSETGVRTFAYSLPETEKKKTTIPTVEQATTLMQRGMAEIIPPESFKVAKEALDILDPYGQKIKEIEERYTALYQEADKYGIAIDKVALAQARHNEISAITNERDKDLIAEIQKRWEAYDHIAMSANAWEESELRRTELLKFQKEAMKSGAVPFATYIKLQEQLNDQFNAGFMSTEEFTRGTELLASVTEDGIVTTEEYTKVIKYLKDAMDKTKEGQEKLADSISKSAKSIEDDMDDIRGNIDNNGKEIEKQFGFMSESVQNFVDNISRTTSAMGNLGTDIVDLWNKLSGDKTVVTGWADDAQSILDMINNQIVMSETAGDNLVALDKKYADERYQVQVDYNNKITDIYNADIPETARTHNISELEKQKQRELDAITIRETEDRGNTINDLLKERVGNQEKFNQEAQKIFDEYKEKNLSPQEKQIKQVNDDYNALKQLAITYYTDINVRDAWLKKLEEDRQKDLDTIRKNGYIDWVKDSENQINRVIGFVDNLNTAWGGVQKTLSAIGKIDIANWMGKLKGLSIPTSTPTVESALLGVAQTGNLPPASTGSGYGKVAGPLAAATVIVGAYLNYRDFQSYQRERIKSSRTYIESLQQDVHEGTMTGTQATINMLQEQYDKGYPAIKFNGKTYRHNEIPDLIKDIQSSLQWNQIVKSPTSATSTIGAIKSGGVSLAPSQSAQPTQIVIIGVPQNITDDVIRGIRNQGYQLEIRGSARR